MIEREKRDRVIDHVISAFDQWENDYACGEDWSDIHESRDIVLALVKAQEPITPHFVDWGIYECPKCKTRVDKTYKYCKYCGQAVKWE